MMDILSFVLLRYFGICIGRWSFLESIHNVRKTHGCQQHFDFEILKVELPYLELLNGSTYLALN